MLDTLAVLFAQRPNFPNNPGGPGPGGGGAEILGIVCGCSFWLIMLALTVFLIAACWKIFVKAGEPGWASLIPIYNMMVLAKIAGKEEWYGLLCLIPVAGIIFAIIIWAGVCERFGKGGGYVIGILLLPYVFIPMLGFGSAQYQGGGGNYGRRRSRRDYDEDEDEEEEERPRRRPRSRRDDYDEDND